MRTSKQINKVFLVTKGVYICYKDKSGEANETKYDYIKM